MADIEIVHQHKLGRTIARQRAVEALNRLVKKHTIMGARNGDVYTVRSPATGTFTVGENAVIVSLTLGILTKSIKPRIDAGIREELAAALDT